MTKKSILALLLVLTMCLSLFPSVAFAAEDVEPAPVPEEEEIVQSGEVEVVSESAENTVNSSETVTVTFNANGGVLNGETSVKVAKGGVVSKEAAPTASKEGEEFKGWYIDSDANESGTVLSELFELGKTPVNENITLTAHYAAANLTKQQQEDIESKGTATGGEEKGSTDPVVRNGNSSWSGSGMKEDPYKITTAEELAALATAVNGGNPFTGVYFEVTAPIAVSNWTSIGSPAGANINGGNGAPQNSYNYFGGYFDGGNKTISGLTAPLFGAVNGATISKVTISGANISGTDFVGALVGYAYNSSITGASLTNVTVSGKHFVGGAIGYAASTAINNCSAALNAVSAADDSGNDGDDVGGLVGYFGPSATLTNCTVNGGTVSGVRQVGGLAGLASASGAITSCSVSNVTILSNANANANQNKLTFGGMFGAVNSSCGTVSGSVSGVTVKDGAYTTNVRKGLVTAGVADSSKPVALPTINVTVSDSTLEVSTAAQLAAVAAAVNAGDSFAGNTVKLVSDIDLANVNSWTPIGNGYYDSSAGGVTGGFFAGTFDGGSKTISNLNVSTSGNSAAGLFGIVNGGTVKNLTVSGAIVSSQNRFAGAIVGGMTAGTIENCTVSGDVAISGKHFVGGVAGMSYGTITGCTVNATGTISAADSTGEDGDDVGGVVGFVQTANGRVINSKVDSTGLTLSGIRQVGGVAGAIDGNASIDNASSAKGVTAKSIATTETVANNKPTNTIGLVVGRISNKATSAGTATGSTLEVALPGQLTAIAAEVNAGNSFAGNTVKLVNDINLNSVNWTPIGFGAIDGQTVTASTGALSGDNWKAFSGTFDGNNKTISNLSISSAHQGSGLFGAINGATIKDLTVNNVSIAQGAGDFIGAIAGYSYNSSLNNCDVTGTISISSNHYVGGAVGYAAKTSFTDVDVTGGSGSTIAAIDAKGGADGDDAGGMVGFIVNGCSISGSDVRGVKVSGSRQCGGLVGFINGATAQSTVSGTVSNVVVECIANDDVFSSRANKVAFGGLVGSMTNVNLGTEISGTVRNVDLTVGSSVSEDNKGKVRLGFVTGGDYNKENFVAANAMAGEIIVIDCTKVAGTKAVATPSVLIDGPHEHSYGEPTWQWTDTNATATFTCTANDSTVEQPATMNRSSSEAGKVTYTATAASPNGEVYTDSKAFEVSYKVKFNNDEATYSYGAVAHFHSDTPVDWKVYAYGDSQANAVTRAKACTDFYFAVTEAVNVITADVSSGDLEVITIKQAVGGSKTMTYQVQWSLPAEATNVTATIYRCRDDNSAITTPDGLLNAANLRTWDCNMNTRNGDYTYNVIKLTSGSKQTIMLQITYWMPGETQAHTVSSELSHIAIS